MSEETDLVLQTLLVAAAEIAPSLDEALVRQCYAIQSRYQFSDDRSHSANAMERLIDEKVARMSASELSAGADNEAS